MINTDELDLKLFTKSGKPRKRRQKQKNVYFTIDTQNAILEFVKTKDQKFRDSLYKSKIEYAFHKLTQNIINTYKLYDVGNSIEDLQQEAIEHLLQKLYLFDPEKGAAYSYFGTITKRFFIARKKKAYTRMIEHVAIDPVYLESDTAYSESFDVEPFDLDTVILNFIKLAKTKLTKLFPSPIDKGIADSVLYLFEKIDKLEIFNKKAILVYLKEMNPEVDSTQINLVLKSLYDIYKDVYAEYLLD